MPASLARRPGLARCQRLAPAPPELPRCPRAGPRAGAPGGAGARAARPRAPPRQNEAVPGGGARRASSTPTGPGQGRLGPGPRRSPSAREAADPPLAGDIGRSRWDMGPESAYLNRLERQVIPRARGSCPASQSQKGAGREPAPPRPGRRRGGSGGTRAWVPPRPRTSSPPAPCGSRGGRVTTTPGVSRSGTRGGSPPPGRRGERAGRPRAATNAGPGAGRPPRTPPAHPREARRGASSGNMRGRGSVSPRGRRRPRPRGPAPGPCRPRRTPRLPPLPG